jgi:hypothetical protein
VAVAWVASAVKIHTEAPMMDLAYVVVMAIVTDAAKRKSAICRETKS